MPTPHRNRGDSGRGDSSGPGPSTRSARAPASTPGAPRLPESTEASAEPWPSVSSEELVVFCDFDGTFSVQDVGSTLAKRHLGERRAELWARWERGEQTAWEYTLALFDGFRLPRERLEEFLRSVELDPGAARLVAWCRERDVPFRILSDGFDYNLDRLQAINGVSFAYSSNHLRYEGDVWRIEPGGRDPDCPCGTGTCKRRIIQARREERPGSFSVHVGNGRVSDLCGAMAADLAFAKDTLAPALDELGVAYRPFETLDDVIEGLTRLTEPTTPGSRAGA